MSDLQYFIDNGGGKKIYFDEVCHLSSRLSSAFSQYPFIIEWLAIHRPGDREY